MDRHPLTATSYTDLLANLKPRQPAAVQSNLSLTPARFPTLQGIATESYLSSLCLTAPPHTLPTAHALGRTEALRCRPLAPQVEALRRLILIDINNNIISQLFNK